MNAELTGRFADAFMANYPTPTLALVRGEGATVWDADGREYLDLLAGIAVSSLGHGHPALVEAVTRQVAILAHTSNIYANRPAIALAERLIGLLGAPASKVFLCNDGATANEAAIKVALRHHPHRRRFVAAERSFHGRTLGALALTGKAAIREPFEPPALTVTFVPYGDPDALTAAVTGDTAAVFLEPTLGESGVVPPPAGYLRHAREVCDRTGALLVIDEIQGGIGRTGRWFACQHEDVVPDVLTLAKGLAGGLPIGACLAAGAAATAFGPGDHGSTFGGNPVSCAAALAVLDTIGDDGLLASVEHVGGLLVDGITARPSPLVAGIRGRGLWLGIALTRDIAPAVSAAAQDAGFLVNAPVPDALRLTPPLVLSAAEVIRFLSAWPDILAAAAASQSTR